MWCVSVKSYKWIRPNFVICWITFYFQEFQSAAIKIKSKLSKMHHIFYLLHILFISIGKILLKVIRKLQTQNIFMTYMIIMIIIVFLVQFLSFLFLFIFSSSCFLCFWNFPKSKRGFNPTFKKESLKQCARLSISVDYNLFGHLVFQHYKYQCLK